MGPSGSGKSSLLRLLNLLTSPTRGEIIYKNKNIQDYVPTELRRSIGYILQNLIYLVKQQKKIYVILMSSMGSNLISAKLIPI